MNIEFLNLARVNQPLMDELCEAACRVIKSGRYIHGGELLAFEEAFARYCGSKHCIGVANGLDALTLTLLAWKKMGRLKEGDEVLVPANTYIASILAITENRLKPVFVEPDIHSYNINPAEIEKNLGKRSRVILPVHLYGRIADMQPIMTLAKAHHLLILEDSAQAHGAALKGTRAGNWGHASAFSFYPGKNLGAMGDAGAVTTNDSELFQLLSALGNYGCAEKYKNLYQGVNSRLDEIQAAMLTVKLRHLDEQIHYRREIARRYLNEIHNPAIILPESPPMEEHVWHLFVIRTERRQALSAYLRQEKIETMIHYPIPAHKQPAYQEYNHCHLPITEKIHNEVLSLPLNPAMEADHISRIIDKVNAFV